jgi:hypothetical protein
MPDPMLHPEFETLSAVPLRRLQEDLWRVQWARVRAVTQRVKGFLALAKLVLVRELPANRCNWPTAGGMSV